MASQKSFAAISRIVTLVACWLSPISLRAQDSPPVVASQQLLDTESLAVGLPLTFDSVESTIHILPVPGLVTSRAAKLELAPTAVSPLIYHDGGAIMPTVSTYAIFWVPPSLQNGPAKPLTKNYQDLVVQFLTDYPGHGISNNNTQYFQKIGGITTYVKNAGVFVESFLDTSPYPASGCTDAVTPGNCITDAQIQAEVQRVMSLRGWTGGLEKMFFIFTLQGEGSCFDSRSSSCAYTQTGSGYCAFHGFIKGSTPIIYANMPYGDPAICQVPGVPSPSGDAAADAVITATSHELTEAITDPLLNAWFTAQGEEIGDLCNLKYGANSWDGGKANQMWNGHFYEIQTEFSNHVHLPPSGGGCVQVGP